MMKNDFIDISCEGSVEIFIKTAIKMIKEKTPGDILLRVPNDWWMTLCLSMFIEECEWHGIREEEEPIVDITFDVVDTRSFREISDLSDEEIQDLIDEFIENLEDINDLDDDDEQEED